MRMKLTTLCLALSAAGLLAPAAQAITLKGESFDGSFDSTISFGFGQRVERQSCSLVGDITGPCGASADYQTWSNGDDGNLNYNKGDRFATYLKGNHELLLKLPSNVSVMVRANWMYDAAADDTRRTPLLDKAKKQMTADVNLMDFWVSKSFRIGDQSARVRLGQQVVNWGESLFAPGGINATNAMDINRLSSPGMQLKEVVLPAPMVSLAASLGSGVNLEAYYQWKWKENTSPASGSYWSVADLGGKGSPRLLPLDGGSCAGGSWCNGGIDMATWARANGGSLANAQSIIAANAPGANNGGVGATGYAFGVAQAADQKARDSGQYGLSVRWRPEGKDTDYGFYYLNYHDKSPNLRYWIDVSHPTNAAQTQLVFLEDRTLYGVSANTTLGNWAVGAEYSYRPKDAVSMTACNDPASAFSLGPQTGRSFVSSGPDTYSCDGWVDMKRHQVHLTGILSLTPGDHGGFLSFVGADTGTFLGEFIWTHYPGVRPDKVYTRTVNGHSIEQIVAAGAYSWPGDATKTNYRGVGTQNSYGYMFDFSLVYDSSIIPGWQVIPGVFVMHAIKGETPNFVSFWLEGAKSANFYLNFVKNPAKWQAGINYTTFWGGKSPYHQPLKDRDFIGGYVSYNF